MSALILQIHEVPEATQYTQTILNFILLPQYILHNEKTLRYIEYTLYKLEREKYHLSNIGLLTPTYIDQPLTTLSFMQSATLFNIFGIIIVW